jgi:membrane-bound ClpP family serine protease
MRQQVLTGLEGMLGKKGLVIEDIDPEGKIKYFSEIWGAATKGNRFLKGQHVMICGIRGMMLLVEEIPAGGSRSKREFEMACSVGLFKGPSLYHIL